MIGPQQSFLVDLEDKMWRLGEIYRVEHGAPPAGGPLMLPQELWGQEVGTVQRRMLGPPSQTFGHVHPRAAIEETKAICDDNGASVNNALQPRLTSAGVPSAREIRQVDLPQIHCSS